MYFVFQWWRKKEVWGKNYCRLHSCVLSQTAGNTGHMIHKISGDIDTPNDEHCVDTETRN
jgi:hypothetical protein